MPAISHQETRSQSDPTLRAHAPVARILRPLVLVALMFPLVACGGHRVLMVDSVPQGALVRLDEDVIGRTPLEYNFQHYGRRRLSLYLPGYRTYSEKLHLKTPWHAQFPVDIVTEVLLPSPFGYEKSVTVTLKPDDGKIVYETLESFVERAETLRNALAIPTAPPAVDGGNSEGVSEPDPTPTTSPDSAP